LDKIGKGERTKHQIELKAMALASKIGLGSLTIGGLAKEVGMSKSGLFAHFKSKENLQLSVLYCYNSMYMEKVWEPALQLPKGVERLRAFLQNWLEFIHSDLLPGGCVFRSAGYELDDTEGATRDLLVKMFNNYYKGVYSQVEKIKSIGEFKKDLDVKKFIYEAEGIVQAYNLFDRLLQRPNATEYLIKSFDELLERSRV